MSLQARPSEDEMAAKQMETTAPPKITFGMFQGDIVAHRRRDVRQEDDPPFRASVPRPRPIAIAPLHFFFPSRSQGVLEYRVHWEGKPASEDDWFIRNQVSRLGPMAMAPWCLQAEEYCELLSPPC